MQVNTVHLGKMEEVLKEFPPDFFDAIVTDPPYGLKFMGKHWDYDVPSVMQWREALRVLKPGGYLLSFGGTRTYHRMVVNIEDAGFEVRDTLAYLYATGMPKGQNVALGIDKKAGVIGHRGKAFNVAGAGEREDIQNVNGKLGMAYGEPVTDEAKKWNGWNTNLKPAMELICMARKPLSEKTIVENVLKHGTGGINIDACRIPGGSYERPPGKGMFFDKKIETSSSEKGRYPSNVLLDGSKEVIDAFPEASGQQGDVVGTDEVKANPNGIYGKMEQGSFKRRIESNKSASRFFYGGKASGKERGSYNDHPTVKSLELMKYLVQLVVPLQGVVLDIFAGSGSTGRAAQETFRKYVLVEMEESSCDIINRRLKEKK